MELSAYHIISSGVEGSQDAMGAQKESSGPIPKVQQRSILVTPRNISQDPQEAQGEKRMMSYWETMTLTKLRFELVFEIFFLLIFKKLVPAFLHCLLCAR